MLNFIVNKTNEYIENMPKNERKKYGQFFTSPETAVFMAGLYQNIWQDQEHISILDTGAGSGVLTAALLERIAKAPGRLQSVQLVCYENDEKILDLLRDNLEYMAGKVPFQLQVRIITENYITSQAKEFTYALLADPMPQKYDMVIGNPPYMKIPKDAPEALAMPNVCYGAPNLYFLFAAMALFNLEDGREMVYIIPRSWTSGAYFKAFREYFLTEGKILHVHLFVSRDKVFEKEKVLQETIIIKIMKTQRVPEYVCITSSNSNHDFADIQSLDVPYDVVVSGRNRYVYLVTTPVEAQLLAVMNRWQDTLLDLGMRMKTGLTVDFRERQYLRDIPEENTVPMFFAQHLKDGRIVYPCGKHGEYLLRGKQALLQRNSNYLFVKRFTSKEEKRRLQCGIYLSSQFPAFDFISTQNKINFIDNATHTLSKPVVYGLYVLFNSTMYDQYYRILNGSTQVNSTEINTMPMPKLAVIIELGLALLASEDLSEENCNRILEEFLNVEEKRGKRIS